MFTIDNTLTELNVREKNILKLLFSMNVHQVATPEMILEEAKSYILFFREPSGMVSAYIALYLTVTDRRLFYVNSSNPFPESDIDAIEEEALEFADGLGAMLDEKDFTMMTMEDKKSWIDAQEIFNPKAEPAPTPSAPEEAQAVPELPAPALTPPIPTVEETSIEPVTATPTQAAPAPPALTPTQTTPLPAPPVQEASQEPIIAPPPVKETAPVQQTQPVQRAPVQPVPQAQPPSVSAAAAVESAEPVSSPEPSDLHEQKIRNRNAAVSRYTISSGEAARKRQEILQKAIKEGMAKTPKRALHDTAASSTGVVSRDREALARLLTSF
ncbi:MAG TPA: hypothetical protein VEJ22_00760 [Nitrospirota bacterium]|nr:hypothetical protein [Nitrospirota bacterium]